MVLETQRLILRELTWEDFDDLYEVLADSDNMQHYPYTFDTDRVRNWIRRNMERYSIFGFGLWAVVLKETGEMIGDCGITMQRINGTIKPEIGYHIKKKHQRKGYAGEAAWGCRDWAFDSMPLRTLYSYMKSENSPSQATARANGMRMVEQFVDDEGDATVVYAITRDEWRKEI